MSFVVHMTGHRETSKTLDKLADRYPRALNLAVFSEAIEVMRLARIKAPYDTGALHDSAYLAPTAPWSARAWGADGGFGVWYAYIVHSFHRTKARFLDMAMAERRSGQVKRIAAETHARVRSGNMSVPRSEIPRVPKV